MVCVGNFLVFDVRIFSFAKVIKSTFSVSYYSSCKLLISTYTLIILKSFVSHSNITF